MSDGLRVLIADDHPIVRRGLREILATEPDVIDVIEAAHPQQVLDLAGSSDVDVVVLDLGLPGRGGLDVLKDLRRALPKLPVLILSMQPEEQYAVRALRAGAAGYLTKDAAPAKLIEAIKKVTAGGRYISPAVAEQLAASVAAGATKPPQELLSDREFEVLRLIASGKTVGDIAERLALSVKTVSSYRARLLEKMGLSNNAELMRYAIEHKLVD
jgi:two-component system, NarL family, invasion response regulator UvrY